MAFVYVTPVLDAAYVPGPKELLAAADTVVDADVELSVIVPPLAFALKMHPVVPHAAREKFPVPTFSE